MNNPHRRTKKKSRVRRPDVSDLSSLISCDSSAAPSVLTASSSSSSSQSTTAVDDDVERQQRASYKGDGSRSSRQNSQPGQGGQQPHKGLVGFAILALCLFNILDVDIRLGDSASDGDDGRRSLLSNLYLSGPSTLMPWAEHHVVDVMDRPDPEKETALFWRELLFSSARILCVRTLLIIISVAN